MRFALELASPDTVKNLPSRIIEGLLGCMPAL